MGNNNSPLETLAAFAICFVAGVVSTVGMGVYSKWVKKINIKSTQINQDAPDI